MARPRYRGLTRNGPATLSAEAGRGRTPRKTAGSIATVAAGLDGHGRRRKASTREHLRQQAPGGVPHHGGLSLELVDHLGCVVGNLLQRLLGKDVRVRPRPFNGFRIVWPVWRQGRV